MVLDGSLSVVWVSFTYSGEREAWKGGTANMVYPLSAICSQFHVGGEKWDAAVHFLKLLQK